MPIDELTRMGEVQPIIRWGDPVLHRPSAPVTDFGAELQRLLADLLATTTAAGGAGLAAPQIGVGRSAFVYDCFDDRWQRRVGVVCNPVLAGPEGGARALQVGEEGCLSLPGGFAELARPDQVVCRGQDQYGDQITILGTGQLARCLQHETDHLRGTVFGDRLSSRTRRGLYRTHLQVSDRYPLDWPVSPRRGGLASPST